jgi:hypothetical protein
LEAGMVKSLRRLVQHGRWIDWCVSPCLTSHPLGNASARSFCWRAQAGVRDESGIC